MLIDEKRKFTFKKCFNRHHSWTPGAVYCTTCGMKIIDIEEEMEIKVCDHCGKEVDLFFSPNPILFCPHCGESTGEHLKARDYGLPPDASQRIM